MLWELFGLKIFFLFRIIFCWIKMFLIAMWISLTRKLFLGKYRFLDFFKSFTTLNGAVQKLLWLFIQSKFCFLIELSCQTMRSTYFSTLKAGQHIEWAQVSKSRPIMATVVTCHENALTGNHGQVISVE